ncbi:MAG TPA: tRNA (N(6)-L-threonylcarbamoyladenosine(37)-C(2))-methylthiotransferase MtaB [Acidobacteriota bacterium]|nr:tRNA (N(6)-L-threonylcarbamoyladenosine(37)-C(2))-methylthiotransferase MtaB [Acidobacteriota bacterium]
MPSVAVVNFGCRANQAEAFAWADALQARGLTLEGSSGRSDVVLVNSCTLTGRADRDVRKLIRTVGRENPAARVVVAGCYAERAPEELAGLMNIVAVLGTNDKNRVVETVARIANEAVSVEPAGPAVERAAAPAAENAAFRARAFLKVQDGCDNRCAFCVIPGLRGRSKSVPPVEVAASVRGLAARGFREIVVAGIHLASYGQDLAPRRSLAELLSEIGEAAQPARLRLSSLDPNLVDDEFIAGIADDPAICRHFHLSLQHASARVLRAMGRPGDAASYGTLLDKLRRTAPEAALGADIIVGFPGETDDDFAELEVFIGASALTYVHAFPFSPRPGTPAWGRPRVPDGVVTARARALRRLSAEKDFRFRRRFLGLELEAVVIRRFRHEAEVLTANDIKIAVPRSPAPRREIVRVRIGRVLTSRTEGEVIG